MRNDVVNLGQLNTAVATGAAAVAAIPIRANNTSGLPAPSATGANSLAVGFGANASGANGTAVGEGAAATREANGSAFGRSAIASGTNSVAVGFNAQATGTNAIAIGQGATASGSVAVGTGASAANGGAAFGDNAVATGVAATAVGPAANATLAGSTAVGNGATATRANQVVIGTAANTLTATGITSAASLAAQTGPVQLVTTDAVGNLATSTLNVTGLGALDGRVTGLEGRVGSLENQVVGATHLAIKARDEARRGTATAIAMSSAPMPSAPGRMTWATNVGTYDGEYAFGGSIAYRLDTRMPIAITAGVAGSRSIGARVGLAGEF